MTGEVLDMESTTAALKALGLGLALAGLFAPATFASGASEERCDRVAVRGLVKEFVAAYNDGNIGRLDRIFATEPEFIEYSVRPLERSVDADDRSTLTDYFRKRHDYRDRLSVQSLDVGREREQVGGFWMRFELVRKSTDPNPLAEGPYHSGKSGVTADCEIRLWRMRRTLP